MTTIEVELTVGMIDQSLALAQLLTADHQVLTVPSTLLPSDAVGGSIVRLQCARDENAEAADQQAFDKTQAEILAQLTREPLQPVLKIHNYTQTSAVLTWDHIDSGSAELISLALYKNGEKLGFIANALARTSTKLDNLEIDTKYDFELVLSTSNGIYKSNTVKVHTHKMTELSGLTVCLGNIDGFSKQDLEDTLVRMGCRPVQSEVKLDTTHFVCTVAEGPQWMAAQQRNVPVVRPEWIKACESERRLVEVRQYYLSEDVRFLAQSRPRVGSVATAATTDTQPPSPRYTEESKKAETGEAAERSIPELKISEHEQPEEAQAETAKTEPAETKPEPAQESTAHPAQEPQPDAAKEHDLVGPERECHTDPESDSELEEPPKAELRKSGPEKAEPVEPVPEAVSETAESKPFDVYPEQTEEPSTSKKAVGEPSDLAEPLNGLVNEETVDQDVDAVLPKSTSPAPEPIPQSSAEPEIGENDEADFAPVKEEAEIEAKASEDAMRKEEEFDAHEADIAELSVEITLEKEIEEAKEAPNSKGPAKGTAKKKKKNKGKK